MSDEVVVFVTCPSEAADEIAAQLVTESLAACVNIVRSVTSVYRWEGRIEKDEESLLVIKSRLKLWDSLENRIRELHSYDVPEMICIPIVEGLQPYLDWLKASLTGDGQKLGTK
ncbi:MAG TPA: divalent-cation tolerance protein CutA, partial [Candidatus Obscuribacterales bacterium]